MSRRRTCAGELARLFDAAARPVYLIDGDGRLVYSNAACAAWLGVEADALLGVMSRYGGGASAVALEPIAAGLCPPPEVFQGQRTAATVVCARADGATSQRRCEFIPLALSDGALDEQAVLAIVDADGDSVAEERPSDDARELHAALQRAQSWLRGKYRPESLAGRSAGIRRVRRQVKLAAAVQTPVLVYGPAGSGRRHVARAIHYAQPEPLGAFVPLACATLSVESLAECLASLAASGDRAGAASPTLLCQDVDALANEGQLVLVNRLLGRRGAWRWMATSLTPLDELALAGTFHPELAALYSTIAIRMPGFAERREDLPLMAQAFLEELNGRGGRQLSGFTPEALDVLAANPPGGGWDELAEWIREAHGRASGLFIDRAALPDRVRYVSDAAAHRRPVEETIDLETFLGEIELELIQRALAKAKGNKTKAAELLGMNRPRFYRRLEQLGLLEEDGGER